MHRREFYSLIPGNYNMLSAKLVLILIPYYFIFIRMTVQMLSIKCILCLFYS